MTAAKKPLLRQTPSVRACLPLLSRREAKLGTLWALIVDGHRGFATSTQLSNLTINMITKAKAPHSVQPSLAAKAAECRNLVAVTAVLALVSSLVSWI